MLTAVAATVLPIVLAPLAIVALQYLYAWFTQQGIDIFLDDPIPDAYSRVIGLSLAKANVVLIVLLWAAVFLMHWFKLPVYAWGGTAIAGVMLALWVNVAIVRGSLQAPGWSNAQIGLMAFAGGTSPFYIIGAAMLLLLR